ncbi:AAA family ATPase [Candidatus Woesearchaeota archaeon]|nr:AAA family ATPase [Candidatus Woesearchaeota archaeon]
MGVFDNILHSDQTLLKNPDALDFDFIPKIVPYREEEQRKIANAIQPMFSNKTGGNLIIVGSPGVGKTVACRHVLRELEEKSENIMPIYVNCWKKNTSYKIAIGLCEEIGYTFTQNKRTEELLKEAIKYFNKKMVVFVFDEADKAEETDFLYTLIEEVYKKSVLLITNSDTFFEELDDRIKSRLIPNFAEFRPYGLEETRGILKQRIEDAFYPGVWETDAFEAVVEKAYELRDIRIGIHFLKGACDAAESRSSKKIAMRDVQDSISRAERSPTQNKDSIENEERIILDIIRANSGMKIGDFFDIYSKKGGEGGYKTFQRRIKSLDEKGFLKLSKSKEGKGNTTIVEYKERVKSLADFSKGE